MEKSIKNVSFFPGLRNEDAGHAFFGSSAAQIEWLVRVSTEVFGCPLTAPEARSLLSCLVRACSESEYEADPVVPATQDLWPR